ncbi:hypothetical protein BC940DRAFT_303196 [Gongronella butleri]|nr:hypothetical protein BC940DRAFT_303196 [Gongronella butleri]
MSTEYGSVATRDEETPLLNTQVEPQTKWQCIKAKLHTHRFRVLIGWATVLAVTAVLTLSFHYALKEHNQQPPAEGGDENDLFHPECVSDRSYFIALLLSIFVGPFGVDRFYLGYIFLGAIKLLTGGLFGILWVVDMILIALDVLPDHNGCILH